MGRPEHGGPENATVCSSCATFVEDLQEPTMIESATPHEGNSSSRELVEAYGVGVADGLDHAHHLAAA